MKHLQIRLLWLQDEVAARRLELRHIASCNNRADIATKHLSAVQHHRLCRAIGLTGQTDWPAEGEYAITEHAPVQQISELNVVDSPSCLPLPTSFPTWGDVSKLFIPKSSELATIHAAIQVASYYNDFTKVRETAQRHLEGRPRQRTRKPTETQCQLPCPACLEQCPWAQEDEEQLGLLHLVNCAGAHIHSWFDVSGAFFFYLCKMMQDSSAKI